ncbi:MAG: AbrB/MazE/SpoVT family DNA-binding domain-containing protein [Moorea sp. SIO2B7]|nr:AbrB/MazE/SpoVT family DNA-binding domain-containing protein [Moorena sp. SIO2B7]
MPLATLTSKGQTTIPKEVRDRLKLQPGDRIDFVIEGDRVYLKAVNRSVRRLSGMLHKQRMPRLTIEELEESIEQAAAEDVLRSLQ